MPPSFFHRIRVRLAVSVSSALAAGWVPSSLPGQSQVPPPPQPLREFRGAWVATVRGIDFPFEPGDPTAKQQAELTGILDKAVALKLNALIFQVRPAGDAVYASNLEPWSPWLTNEMGKAPDPLWDPLAFFIKEAHARGIELHAWFNPFRALSGPKYKGAGKHITVTHPQWCMKYGEDTWMDPGEPGVRAHSLAVMHDVLTRYDVDGIHMDDYFYPYPVKGAPFPDDRSYNAYQKAGGKLGKSDWRRENVNTFVEELYNMVKREKSWVRVGISPFGIWRPNHPAGYAKGALDPYEALSADSLKWLQLGWVDYMAPQLYWPNEPKNLSFAALFDWWLSQNTARRHIWPGMASDRVLQDRQPHEILRQIGIVRTRAAYMPPGHLHWNYSALGKNKGTLADLCRLRAYQDFAIPPSASWLGMEKPLTPVMNVSGNTVSWDYLDERMLTLTKWWYVQTYENGNWVGKRLLPTEVKIFTLPPGAKAVAIRAISRSGVSGDPVVR